MKKRLSSVLAFGLGCLVSGAVFADGKTVYDKSCKMCHASGMAGAPKVGDKAEWKVRIAKGVAELEHNAINGIQGYAGAMPPKGGNPKLSDDDVKAAVAYMVSASQ